MFADTIRNSNTEHEIYFLLTSYLEAVRFCDKLNCCFPERITHLPLNDIADVRERFRYLMIELDAASKRLDDSSCTVLREGVHILGAGLNRLRMLDEQRQQSHGMAAAGMDAQAA